MKIMTSFKSKFSTLAQEGIESVFKYEKTKSLKYKMSFTLLFGIVNLLLRVKILRDFARDSSEGFFVLVSR